MTQNFIVILTIIELLASFLLIYLIIRANIIVNTLQQEVNLLHLHLPSVIRDLRQDLTNLNSELIKYVDKKFISAQKIGYLVGKIFTEILLFRMSQLQINKKFLIISIISKIVNLKKLCL